MRCTGVGQPERKATGGTAAARAGQQPRRATEKTPVASQFLAEQRRRRRHCQRRRGRGTRTQPLAGGAAGDPVARNHLCRRIDAGKAAQHIQRLLDTFAVAALSRAAADCDVVGSQIRVEAHIGQGISNRVGHRNAGQKGDPPVPIAQTVVLEHALHRVSPRRSSALRIGRRQTGRIVVDCNALLSQHV